MSHAATATLPHVDPVQAAPRSLIAAGVTLAIALLMPTLVAIAPEIYWDLDPRSPESNVPITMLGPAGFAWYAVLSMLIATAALAIHHRHGGRIRWWTLGLATIGMLGIAWHMPDHFANQYHGLNWLTAISLAVAISHLGEHAAVRRILAVACIGMLAPLAIGALKYVLIEHPMTLEHFHQNEADFLRARGWTEGSTHHKSYVRRISFPDVTGSFGLSNVFGSIMVALTLLAAGVMCGPLKSRCWHAPTPGERWQAAWPGILVLAGLVTVYLTHSKGATLALVMAAGLLGLVLLTLRWPKLGKLIAPAAMLAVVVALGVVLARGAMGPPNSAEGERSLLFRFHYWQAAADIFAAHPVTGVGPGQYQQHYTAAKPPINPEDVTSNHSVFIDYLTMIGLPGLALIALLLGWLWLSARHAVTALIRESDAPPAAPPPGQHVQQINPRALAIGGVLIAGIFLPEVVIELPTLLTEISVLAWMLGAGGFLVTFLLLLAPHRLSDRWLSVGLFAAAAALLIHNQIELAFFHVGSGIIAMGLVALAATQPRDTTDVTAASDTETAAPRRAPTALGYVPAIMLGAAALLLAVLIALPIQAQQTHLRNAAIALRSEATIDQVNANLRLAAEANPVHPRPYRSQVSLLMQTAWSANQHGSPTAAEASLRGALDVLDQAQSHGLEDLVLLRQRAQIYEQLAQIPGHTLAPAIDAYRVLLVANPYSIQDHLRLANLLWQADRKPESREVYRHTLDLSEQAYLDPLKQLTEQQVAAINARLAEE